jgi:hypothetical protein
MQFDSEIEEFPFIDNHDELVFHKFIWSTRNRDLDSGGSESPSIHRERQSS